ncbi:uncharacterized protein ACN427_003200 [Glossina fuscipes fuscipes]
MDWPTIVQQCKSIKERFDKSYKCLNIDRPTSADTIYRHVQILVECLEEIRTILNVNYERLTSTHKSTADKYFQELRGRILTITNRRGIEIPLSNSLHETIKPYHTIAKSSPNNMPQTLVEFLKTASSLIPDFDGKIENLQSFIDSLELLDTIKETYEAAAISLVKTKLKGATRNLISHETTLIQIRDTLKNKIKGESVEVVTAKIMNLQQRSKAANQYTKEIEDLTKALEGAYIADGLTNTLAAKYSTQQAIKAMTRNCSIDKVKLIMEAGTFNNMNEAITKFVNSCTEPTSNCNTVCYYRNKPNVPTNYRGRSIGRYNYGNNYQRREYTNNRRSNNNYNNGNRNNSNQARVRNNRNVRITQSENNQTPLSE